MLQSGEVAVPGTTPQQATSLLYAGEQFDVDAQQYYLRARYYDPLNGRFNRLDPFAGNNRDPQSLHKYLYCHANPINRTDPGGHYSLTEMVTVSAIMGLISAAYMGAVTAVRGGTVRQVLSTQARWFLIGFSIGAVVYVSHAVLVALFGASAGFGHLQYAEEYRIQRFDDLREVVRGTGLFRHHIIEKRFAEALGLDTGNMLAIIVDKAEHLKFTNAWRNHIAYGTGIATATKDLIWEKAQIIYAEYPALLEAARIQLSGDSQ